MIRDRRSHGRHPFSHPRLRGWASPITGTLLNLGPVGVSKTNRTNAVLIAKQELNEQGHLAVAHKDQESRFTSECILGQYTGVLSRSMVGWKPWWPMRSCTDARTSVRKLVKSLSSWDGRNTSDVN